nr:hypothetical protein [Natronomonas sp. CBA1123]
MDGDVVVDADVECIEAAGDAVGVFGQPLEGPRTGAVGDGRRLRGVPRGDVDVVGEVHWPVVR